MYKGKYTTKHSTPTHLRRRRRNQRKWLAVTIISIICCVISGITLAYVFTQTDALKNTFVPAQVSCDVLEGQDGSTFDGTTKSDVKIKNTGETTAYIRAAVVVTWMSEDGTQVTATKPVEGTDYQITYNTDSDWVHSSDGFWYYTIPVDVDGQTDTLIESCVCSVTPPDGFYLSVEIVASAIQSSPSTVVTEYWSSGVAGVNETTLVLEIKR